MRGEGRRSWDELVEDSESADDSESAEESADGDSELSRGAQREAIDRIKARSRQQKGGYAELFERFPELERGHSPPTLVTAGGFGQALYGSKDFDPKTGTYVTTLWLVIMNIPVLPLSAWRVFPVSYDSYQFIGKVPLSGYSGRVHVPLMALALALGLAAFSYVNFYSRSGQVSQSLARAARAEKSGDIYESWRLTVHAYRLDPTRADTARLLQQSMQKTLPRASPVQIDEILSNPDLICSDFFADSDWTQVIRDVLTDGYLEREPRATQGLIEKWRKFEADPKSFLTSLRLMLEGWLRKKYRRRTAEVLAGVYRELGEEELAKSLLESKR